jgi:MinD-like ATPase involved in chromosome partitioning or flagellar assembly
MTEPEDFPRERPPSLEPGSPQHLRARDPGPPTERIPVVRLPAETGAPDPNPWLQPQPEQWTSAPPRPTKPRPTQGWRKVLLSATFGLVNLGPSPAERRLAHLEALVAAPLRGHFKIGVLGKGGVGKTTVAASVGSVFAELRRSDRVVALDADTAFGRLGSRIDPRADGHGSYWELATNKNIRSFADLLSKVGSNSAGLYVLAGESGSRRRMLDPAVFREASLRLDQHFTISIIDCGSTMDAPVTQEALRDMDALIVVSSPWPDGASAAAQVMEWLARDGRTGLLRRSVVVLNDSDGHSDKRTRDGLAEQFRARGQAVVAVPFDPRLRPGGVIEGTAAMSPAARQCFVEVAAAIAQHFTLNPPHGGGAVRH